MSWHGPCENAAEIVATEDATSAEGTPTANTVTDAAEPRKVRSGIKQAQLIETLRSPEGASIEEIVAATGWHKAAVADDIGSQDRRVGVRVAYRVSATSSCSSSRRQPRGQEHHVQVWRRDMLKRLMMLEATALAGSALASVLNRGIPFRVHT